VAFWTRSRLTKMANWGKSWTSQTIPSHSLELESTTTTNIVHGPENKSVIGAQGSSWHDTLIGATIEHCTPLKCHSTASGKGTCYSCHMHHHRSLIRSWASACPIERPAVADSCTAVDPIIGALYSDRDATLTNTNRCH
jgi:hypothetical protein